MRVVKPLRLRPRPVSLMHPHAVLSAYYMVDHVRRHDLKPWLSVCHKARQHRGLVVWCGVNWLPHAPAFLALDFRWQTMLLTKRPIMRLP